MRHRRVLPGSDDRQYHQFYLVQLTPSLNVRNPYVHYDVCKNGIVVLDRLLRSEIQRYRFAVPVLLHLPKEDKESEG